MLVIWVSIGSEVRALIFTRPQDGCLARLATRMVTESQRLRLCLGLTSLLRPLLQHCTLHVHAERSHQTHMHTNRSGARHPWDIGRPLHPPTSTAYHQIGPVLLTNSFTGP